MILLRQILQQGTNQPQEDNNEHSILWHSGNPLTEEEHERHTYPAGVVWGGKLRICDTKHSVCMRSAAKEHEQASKTAKPQEKLFHQTKQ